MELYGHCACTLPNLLVAGTPCQSFSVAGLRKGTADARGNLT
ncbi:DNA cytosine methyltransferase [Roseobacter sp. MED193]|nr:DNA cytosine methyltransferase [Roseobacter sp. MED193]